MSRARKLLITGGLGLALWGMSYGLWYAVWVEHQTLDAMGGNLAGAFVHAAEGRMPAAHAALDAYAATAFDYARQVDVHSHWIGLAMLLIVLGVVFDRVGFDAGKQMGLAVALVIGSAIFPLGVVLQTVVKGALADGLAIVGAGLVIAGLAGVAVGFAGLKMGNFSGT